MKPEQKHLIIYHANCMDGFAAMCAMKYALKLDGVHPGRISTWAAKYDEPFPAALVTGLTNAEHLPRVYIVDFSYTPAILWDHRALWEQCILIDHHEKAIQQWASQVEDSFPYVPNVQTYFKTDHSGATLTWKAMGLSHEVPVILLHVADRDLWQFKFEGTRELNALLYSFGFGSELEDIFMYQLETNDRSHIQSLIKQGTALLRAHDRRVEQAKKTARYHSSGEFSVPVLNCSPDLASDVLSQLCKDHSAPMAISYCDSSFKRLYSARSLPGGWNVNKICQIWGGGGHPTAAGFSVFLNQVNVITGLPENFPVFMDLPIEYVPIKEEKNK